MAKKNSNKGTQKTTITNADVGDVEVETIIETPKASSAPITAPALPTAVSLDKMSREEWRALTPEQKAARKAARAANRPSVRARLARTVGKLVRRIGRLSSIFAGQDGVTDELARAKAALDGALDTIALLPQDWTPKSVAVPGTPKLAVGDIVAIHPKRRSAFEGLLEANELDGLRVTKIVGKRLVCQAEGGTKITLAINTIVKTAA